ncbi:MAG: endolytic transglycosylase MltG [Nitriliruptorales bacterium]
MALRTASKVVVVVLVLMLGAVGGGVYYLNWLMSGEPGSGQAVEFEIEEGDSAASVAERLADEGIVRSALLFRLRARSAGLDRGIVPGTYTIRASMSIDDVIDAILAGPTVPRTRETFRFTVPEGLTVAETLERLANQTPFTVEDYRAVLDGELELPSWWPDVTAFPEDVREPLEGLLFPETYEMFADTSAVEVLQRLIDELVKVVEGAGGPTVEIAEGVELSRYELLVLASLVEEEARIAEERPTIAGVIVNRLQAGMQLQIDATILYAQDRKGRVLNEDLEIESSYNTYRNAGLPPTPISAPGKAAIAAAFGPEEHAFLYYVKIDEEGHHAFAETFAEHQRNRQRLDELRREASEGPEDS